MQQYSKIPTMSGPGHATAASPRSYTTRTPSRQSRSRRGSSTSEDEHPRRGAKPSLKTQTRGMASQERPPATQRQPTGSSQSSQPSSAPSSGNRGPWPTQHKDEPATSALRFGKVPLTDNKPRNVLRRKGPSIEQYRKGSKGHSDVTSSVPGPNAEAMAKAAGDSRDRSLSRQPSPATSYYSRRQPSPNPAIAPGNGNANAPKPTPDPPISSVPKELRGLSAASTKPHTATIPHSAPAPPSASSPSTMYSDSPGPWSSRTSTPTSISSYSPGVLQSTKIGSRLRQPSPNIPGMSSVQHRSVRHPSPLDSTSTTALTTGSAASISSSPQRIATDSPITPPTSDKQPTESQMKMASLAYTPSHGKGQTSSSTSPAPGPRDDDSGIKSPAGSAPTTTETQATGPDRSSPLSRLPTSAASSRPSRPSRKGTAELHLESSPVIHSRLPVSRLPEHKRRNSRSIPSRPNDSAESLQSTSSSYIPRRSPSPNITNAATRSQPGGSNLQDQCSAYHDPAVVRTPDVPQEPERPATSEKPKRFGIFSKKSRTVPEVTSSRSGESQTRKGPAAGTGHEGYGRYMQRGRRLSAGSSTGRGRSTSTSGSTSQASITSRAQPGMDDFLRDRLEPIVISGGGSDGGELTRTQSEQSVTSLSVASTTSSASYGGYLARSPDSYSQSSLEQSGPKKQEEHKPPKRAVLIKRQSLRKNQDKQSARRQPPGTPAGRPSVDNPNSSVSSLAQSEIATQNRPYHSESEKGGVKSKGSQKWPKLSFFQRSHHIQRKEPQADLRAAAIPEVPVSVNKVPAPRQQPYYAIVDSEQTDTDSLEDILRRIEDSPPTEEEEAPQDPVGLGLKQRHGPSVLLPEPPSTPFNYTYEDYHYPQSPKVFFNKDLSGDNNIRSNKEEPQTEMPRANRLTSVGRIPKVVHRKDHQHNTPAQSFSRPFSRAEGSSLTTVADNSTVLSPSTGPVGRDSGHAATKDSHIPSVDPYTGQQFFSFSQRKDSDVSHSNSSDSRVSLAPVTAVIPPSGSKLTDDEVWDEYDDLIDHVAPSPDSNAGTQHGTRRRSSRKLANQTTQALQEGLDKVDRDYTVSYASSCSVTSGIAPTVQDDVKSSVHLRRSMVASALHSSLTPSTKASFSEFYSEGGKESNDKHTYVSKPQEAGSSTPRQKPLPAPGAERSPNSGTDRKRNTVLLELAERNRNGALAQANLRSGSLMTSRWLSFGRVLFSPAQNHVQSPDQSRILVIDGLGNDDWSFYCALTYPMATVYSLSVSQSSPRSSNPAAWDPPPNHRTVHHAGMNHPFPFPKGFFSVAILRFPAACAEAELRTTVSECKRVLRAGAYLELSVIDLDMVNMGSRARKAVRSLKEQMYSADPSISLKPASDNIQSLLWKRGFQNLNRCMVVVPVAGSIMASSDTSSSSQSTKLASVSSSKPGGSSKSSNQQQDKRPPSDDGKLSLGELLADSSQSASNDESIAKMVARVGRWWYTRCYESSVLVDGDLDRSMWLDRRLLRECQRRGTGFKLLIAYAQKPSELPRRTASV